MKTLVEARNISVGYVEGKAVLEDVCFSAKAGELICLLGINGSGKTSLLHSIGGLLPLLHGTILLQSKRLSDYNSIQRARMVSMVLSARHIAGLLTVEQLLTMGRSPHTNWWNKLSDNDTKIISKVSEMAGLQNLYDRRVSELSDGEKQRALIGRALVQDCPILLLDEPLAHLDPVASHLIAKLLQNVAQESGKCIIFSAHTLEIASYYADTLWLINNKKISLGTPEDLLLKGALQKTFSSSDLYFNPESFSLQPMPAQTHKVRISGEGQAATLTARALQRLGIQHSPEAEWSVTISNEPTEWTLQHEQNIQVAKTLGELIQLLKKTALFNDVQSGKSQ
jgi:iron complex transport system ATP-binding protein